MLLVILTADFNHIDLPPLVVPTVVIVDSIVVVVELILYCMENI